MMLLRGDSRAARHMATSKSTTLGTECGVEGQHPEVTAWSPTMHTLTSAPVATSSAAPDMTPRV